MFLRRPQLACATVDSARPDAAARAGGDETTNVGQTGALNAATRMRLDGAVDAMARFLARALVLKCPDVTKVTSSGKRVEVSLCEVMHEESRYCPDAAKLDYWEGIRNTQLYAENVGRLAARMLWMAEHGDEVDLRIFDGHAGYACGRNYEVRHASFGQRAEYLHLGGVRQTLRDGVASKAADWLEKCDKVLCIARSESWVKDDVVEEIVCKIAQAIAHRQVPDVPSEKSTVAKLSVVFLEKLVTAVFADSAAMTDKIAERDAAGIKMLEVLASGVAGATGTEARAIFEDPVRCARLAETLAEPHPVELGDLSKMKVHLLRRAVLSKSPVETRLALAQGWSLSYGACARVAAQNALRRLAPDTAKRSTLFVDAVKRREPTDPPILDMPAANAFSPCVGAWTAVRPRADAQDRLGRLCTSDRRAVRLACTVWSVLAADERAFKPNVVSTDLLAEIASEEYHLALYLYKQTENCRKLTATGANWLTFCNHLHDRSSDLASKVNIMMCELSHLSVADVCEAFHPEGKYAETTRAPLARRTRQLAGDARSSPLATSGYEQFAHDALTLVFLRVICSRRQDVDVGFYKTPHPLGDLVRSVYEVHSWCPNDGEFCVTLPMLKRAHPLLRKALEELAARLDGTFVRRKGAAKAALGYVFDTPTLLQLVCA